MIEDSKDLNIQNKKEEKIKLLELNSQYNIIDKDRNSKEEEQFLIYENNLLTTNEKTTTNNEYLKKVEPKEICCYKRRIKYPKDVGSFIGFSITSSYFIIFSILVTICLQKTKIAYSITDNLQKTYDILILVLWSLFLMNILLLIDVFSSDPGMQRGTPIPKDKYINGRIKKVIRGKKYFLKYCDTCHLIRDIRTFHCKICEICVEKHDHHCFKVSNCIGVYNYKKFYIFLNSSLIYLFYVFGICLHYLYYNNGKKTTEGWIFLLMILIIICDIFFLLIVFSLNIQHIDVITSNRTTRETIKNKKYKVFDRGLEENCEETFCRDYIRER